MNKKLVVISIAIISVGIGLGFLQITGLDNWVLRVETQCTNPWDEYRWEKMKEYREDPNFAVNSKMEELNLREKITIDFYQTQGIEILDFHIDENFEEPDACEGCHCNAGGHAFFAKVSNSDKQIMIENGWKSTLPPKI